MNQFHNNKNQSIINLVDESIQNISGQNFVPTEKIIDLLLDIRSYLFAQQQEVTSDHES